MTAVTKIKTNFITELQHAPDEDDVVIPALYDIYEDLKAAAADYIAEFDDDDFTEEEYAEAEETVLGMLENIEDLILSLNDVYYDEVRKCINVISDVVTDLPVEY